MAAIVLGALCQAGDRTPWLAAILADGLAFRRDEIEAVRRQHAFDIGWRMGVAA